MNTKIYATVTILFLSIFSFGQEKQQEVLLMGTMHVVPKIVKKSYNEFHKFVST